LMISAVTAVSISLTASVYFLHLCQFHSLNPEIASDRPKSEHGLSEFERG
jgi:hypothetical protein